MGYTMRSGSTISAGVNWTDVNNTAGEVKGDTTWHSADETLVTIEADKNDSTLCRITSLGPTGTTQIIATASALSGKQISTQVDVHVISAEATTGTIYMQSTAVMPMAAYPPPPPPSLMGGGGTLR